MTWFLRLFRRSPDTLAARLIAVSILNATSGKSALR
jgi:hypothetical protein